MVYIIVSSDLYIYLVEFIWRITTEEVHRWRDELSSTITCIMFPTLAHIIIINKEGKEKL